MSEDKIKRRGFMLAATVIPAFSIIPRCAVAGSATKAPSDKLNIAGIGVGGMGAGNLRALERENILALCDVDHNYAARTFKRYPKAKVYKNFRRMLEKQKDIEAVVVATPDHTHAVISMAAIQSGRHVYCQKPLTHDIFEARMLRKEAHKAGVVTQMGIQGHSGEGYRLICEWIWDGAIGRVREVDAWCSLSYYPPGHASWSSKLLTRPRETPPVPAALDWDLWIGPAKYRPYHSCYHPRVWRCWRDFGSGMLGDRGCHTLDPVFGSLKLGYPESVSATSMGSTRERHALASIVVYKFPKRGDLPPVKLTWYDGLRAPRPEELEDGRTMGHPEGGVIFKGDKGKLMCGVYGENPQLIPHRRNKSYNRPAKTIPRVHCSHEEDWASCCKSGKQPGASFDYSSPLAELTVLGNLAILMDTRLTWDGPNMKVTNIPEANKYIKTEYRKGWKLMAAPK